MAAQAKTTIKNPVETAIEVLDNARANLDHAKQDLEFAVNESEAKFYYDPDKGLYVGPDRHNENMVVSWNSKQSQNAAMQMQFKGARTCDWSACQCKRSNPGRTGMRAAYTQDF